MKKYVKPELFYEHFELTQHIASCGWIMTGLMDKENCKAIADPDIYGNGYTETLFTSVANGCSITSDWEDFCHENGSNPAGSTFAS